MYRGYIKLWRRLSDSNLWLQEKFTRGQAWIDLIMLANHKLGYIRIRGIKVEIDRGQLAYSELTLAERWKWSRGKVRRFLKELEANPVQQIVQQKNNLTSLITIINYDQYQNMVQQTGHQTVQQTDTKRYTNKNDKNVKNIKNIYGEFENVQLKTDEYEKLINQFGEVGTKTRIENLSSYIASKGVKYKSHYATILTWERKNTDVKKPKKIYVDIGADIKPTTWAQAESLERRMMAQTILDLEDADNQDSRGRTDKIITALPER